MTMDHERFSELLLPFVEGELGAPERAELEEHLASCSECRLEEQGLRALLAPPDEPMTELERARMHGAVRAVSAVPDRPTTEGPRLAWLPPALGVAALLLVVVVGMQLFQGGMGGDDAESGGSGAESSRKSSDGPRPVTLTLEKDGLKLGTEDAHPAEEAPEAAAAEPDKADDAGALEDEEVVGEPELGGPSDATTIQGDKRTRESALIENRLEDFARSSKVFRSFAGAYTTEDAAALREEFTAELAAQAPNEHRDQLEECTDLVVEARDFATLPVVAAYGVFRTEEAIMVGFIWSPEGDGALDRYLLYVWPQGSCETPLHSQIGKVEAGKD